MYLSVIICEVMSANEAIQFHGFKKYFKNTGYGFTSKFAGEEDH